MTKIVTLSQFLIFDREQGPKQGFVVVFVVLGLVGAEKVTILANGTKNSMAMSTYVGLGIELKKSIFGKIEKIDFFQPIFSIFSIRKIYL